MVNNKQYNYECNYIIKAWKHYYKSDMKHCYTFLTQKNKKTKGILYIFLLDNKKLMDQLIDWKNAEKHMKNWYTYISKHHDVTYLQFLEKAIQNLNAAASYR